MKNLTLPQIKKAIENLGEDKFYASLDTDDLLDALQSHPDELDIMHDLVLMYDDKIIDILDGDRKPKIKKIQDTESLTASLR